MQRHHTTLQLLFDCVSVVADVVNHLRLRLRKSSTSIRSLSEIDILLFEEANFLTVTHAPVQSSAQAPVFTNVLQTLRHVAPAVLSAIGGTPRIAVSQLAKKVATSKLFETIAAVGE